VSAVELNTDDPFEDLFEDDSLDDLFDIEEDSEIVKASGRAGKRMLNVTLEYDPSKITGYSELLMECIATRNVIPEDYNIDRATHWFQALGNLPAKTLAADEDRWQLFIFAAEFIRLHGTPEQKRASQLSLTGKVNPEWDATKENVEQDGRVWGGVEFADEVPPVVGKVEGDFGKGSTARPPTLTIVPPVREQIESDKKFNLKMNKQTAVPAEPVDLEAIKDSGTDPELQTWRLAEEIAFNKPRDVWEGKVDWMLEQKIKYCYSWLEDIGTVPVPYPDNMLNIFWPAPSLDLRDKPKVDRRNMITGKVIDFWRKSVAKNGEGMNLKSDSYRVTLAAMELQKAIEAYVQAGSKFNMENEVQDKVEEGQVQQAAKKYFQAHFPIADLGAGPGPLSTMDPDYVKYIRLCRQYKLAIGTILHETKL
jgi:hypothetical protein